MFLVELWSRTTLGGPAERVLTERLHSQKFPMDDVLELPQGHRVAKWVKPQEGYVAALRRLLKEEFGLSGDSVFPTMKASRSPNSTMMTSAEQNVRGQDGRGP